MIFNFVFSIVASSSAPMVRTEFWCEKTDSFFCIPSVCSPVTVVMNSPSFFNLLPLKSIGRESQICTNLHGKAALSRRREEFKVFSTKKATVKVVRSASTGIVYFVTQNEERTVNRLIALSSIVRSIKNYFTRLKCVKCLVGPRALNYFFKIKFGENNCST